MLGLFIIKTTLETSHPYPCQHPAMPMPIMMFIIPPPPPPFSPLIPPVPPAIVHACYPPSAIPSFPTHALHPNVR
eukprot:2108371-Rhodomonas_salina.4